MSKKSSKKLTPNQAEFERLIRNARQRFNRRLKKGYKSTLTGKDLFSAFERPSVITKKRLSQLKRELKTLTDTVIYAEAGDGMAIPYAEIPKKARAQFNKFGFSQFKHVNATGVQSDVTISLGSSVMSTINDADLAFSNFVEANASWVTDTKKHSGMEYVLNELRDERKNLQNLYGAPGGDAVFAYMLNAIGVVAGTLTSQEANDITAAGRWLAGFYDYRQAGVDEMLKLNEAFGDVE